MSNDKSWQKIAILQSLGSIAGMYRDIQYSGSLPAELEPWHGYLTDAGHCIWSIPGGTTRSLPQGSGNFLMPEESYADVAAYDVTQLMLKGDKEIQSWLIPASVKSVLRGYKIVRGYVVCNLLYDADFGLIDVEDDDNDNDNDNDA